MTIEIVIARQKKLHGKYPNMELGFDSTHFYFIKHSDNFLSIEYLNGIHALFAEYVTNRVQNIGCV